MNITDRDRKVLTFFVPVVIVMAYWFLLLSPQRSESTKLGEQLAEVEITRDSAVAEAQAVSGAKSTFAADFAEVLRVGKAIPTSVDMPALLVQLDKAAAGTDIAFKSIKAGERSETQPLPPPPPTEGQPTDAGGAPAESAPGSAVEQANGAAPTSDAANQAAGADPAAPAGVTGTTDASASGVTGLDTVPLDFTFEGEFFDLTNFFHRLKRFVHVTNKRIKVGGRLMTIDSFSLKMGLGFPTLTAEMKATVYLSPLSEGATAGATPSGPAPVGADGTPVPAGDGSAAPAPTAPTSAPVQ